MRRSIRRRRLQQTESEIPPRLRRTAISSVHKHASQAMCEAARRVDGCWAWPPPAHAGHGRAGMFVITLWTLFTCAFQVSTVIHVINFPGEQDPVPWKAHSTESNYNNDTSCYHHGHVHGNNNGNCISCKRVIFISQKSCRLALLSRRIFLLAKHI